MTRLLLGAVSTIMVSLAEIVDFCQNTGNILRKGELHLKANQLQSFLQEGGTFSGSVAASMKEKSYNTNVRKYK